MKGKITMFIATIFVLTVFAFGLTVIPTRIGQVEAQGMMGNNSFRHNNSMGDMMRGEDRNQTVEMMRNHHGTNWKEHCNKMMQEMDKES